MSSILAIARKDLRLLFRDRAGFFWVLGWPFLMALFFGSIIGGSDETSPMKVALVDEDRTDYSRAFGAELRKSSALEILEAPRDSATTLVRRGRLTGYIALRPGMGASLGFGGDSATIELGLDPSRRAEAGYLEGLVTQALVQSMQGSFGPDGTGRASLRERMAAVQTDTTITVERRDDLTSFYTNLDRFLGSLDTVTTSGTGSATGSDATRALGPNLEITAVTGQGDGPRSAFEVTFPSAMMWALIGVCMSFAISIVQERLTGTYLRLRLAPISKAQILAGKGLAAFLAALGATVLLLAFGSLVLGVRIASVPKLAAAVLACAFCFVGLMMLISTLGRTHQAVAGAGWALLLVQSMTGGGMIPLIAMPPWMQAVSHFSLVKWGVLSVEGAIWRGFSWNEMLIPVSILLAVGGIAFLIGARALHRSDT
ncbi:MAG TPA: ABC transporter permease [Candidatus Eisenbacteria bacterium]|nr:ABC transporter permease [Candidatus Eisenbacteria bacterium]